MRENSIRLGAAPRLLGTEDVNTRHNDDRTPLHFAAQAATPELVALLLDSGADINAVTDKKMPGDLLGDHVLGHGADRHCPSTASQGSRPNQGEHEIEHGIRVGGRAERGGVARDDGQPVVDAEGRVKGS
ncbi:ankyrin repeat domain-containing protein [Nocardia vinacea]|uniref:hypothetical protein n=1 Tax=Nocardia vinacea TaxID=96468 RepID=UPI002E12D627|nr:ankyrin repeat domain-containing protein [Nocardia vinacea]